MKPNSLFRLSDHLAILSKHGDPLEVLHVTSDFKCFWDWLVEGLGYGDGAKDGRPPFDPVSMFKALILQAQRNLSDVRMEFMIRGRLSWMHFLGFDWQLRKKGYIPPLSDCAQSPAGQRMSGQSVGASLVPAPKQRNTEDEKAAIKAAQKDTNARWTLKISGKVRYRLDGTALPMIAIPTFGYKSHIAIDRRYSFIRSFAVTSAAHGDGKVLRRVVTTDNTSGNVWADSAYRSKANEAWFSS